MPASNADLLVALARVGSLFYQRMLARLDAGNYPSGDSERGFTSIQGATSVRSPEYRDGRGVVEIVIDLARAPYAGAYEWGSGEHATKSTPGTYPIRPRQGEYMIFPEGDWPGWQPADNGVKPWNGLFFLTQVEHPGVEAKPYLKPTATEIHAQVKDILCREFKASLLRGGKVVEVIQ